MLTKANKGEDSKVWWALYPAITINAIHQNLVYINFPVKLTQKWQKWPTYATGNFVYGYHMKFGCKK